MKKKVLCMSLAVILLSQTGVMAAQEHKHIWIDDIKNSDETTNRYYCECGEVRDEIIADIRNFIVSFDANGGYVETETVETYKNRIKRLPIPENASDYQWDGWYTEPDGGEIVTEDWIYDSDTTLYAHWTVTGTYTLKFASDGGSYIRPITALYGETLDLTEYVPEKTGYIFKGWYTDPRTKENRVEEYTLNRDGVVYAKWEADSTQEQPDELMNTDTIYLTDEQYTERMQRIKAEWLKLIRILVQTMKTAEGAS